MIKPLGDRVIIEASCERRDDSKRHRAARYCERKTARR